MCRQALSGIAVALVLSFDCSFARTEPSDNRPKAHNIGEPGVIAPKLIHSAAVIYPAAYSPAEETGCTLIALVGADGHPSYIHVSIAAGTLLDQAASQAVRESTYAPGTFRGDRAPVWVDLWVPFHKDRTAGPLELLPLIRVDQPAIVLTAPVESEPAKGQQAKFEGTALISILVGVDGVPLQPHVLVPLGLGLDEKAVALVEKYRFKPAIRKAVPVPQRVVIRQQMYLY